MAIRLDDQDQIEVICSKDEAVTCDGEAYGKYLETLDESLLLLNPDLKPTRFVLKKVLPYGVAEQLRNKQIGYSPQNEEVQLRFGYVMDEVRASLVDIKDAGSDKLSFKKDRDGMASKDLMSVLEAHGIVQELFTAKMNQAKAKQFDKKKSQPSLSSPLPTSQS